MAIACAYCNGEHDTPAQVRQCWNDGGRQDIAVADEPVWRFSEDRGRQVIAVADDPFHIPPIRCSTRSRPRRTASAPPSRRAATQVAQPVERGVAVAAAGPDRLGRHLVIEPGGRDSRALDHL